MLEALGVDLEVQSAAEAASKDMQHGEDVRL